MRGYSCSYTYFFFYFAFDVTLRHHHVVQLVSSVRQRKDELEQRMSTLQESRRELMVQLEQLMMLLKVPRTSLSSLWLHRTQLRRLRDYWANARSVDCGEQDACGDFVSSLPLLPGSVLLQLEFACLYETTWTCVLWLAFFLLLILRQVVSNMARWWMSLVLHISPSCGRSLQLMQSKHCTLQMRKHVSTCYPTCPLEGVHL